MPHIQGPNDCEAPNYLNVQDGPKLFFKQWLPSQKPKTVILLVHGLAEHCLRYRHVASHLNNQGHAVVGFDLRGHGRSEGKRIYVKHFSEYVDDLKTIYAYVQTTYPNSPLFILAHSMGTTISLNFLIDHSPSKISGVILSGTALMPGDDISPILIKLSGIIGTLAPKLPTVKLNSSTISRDPAVVQAYNNDPFVYNGKIPARTGAELNRVFGYIRRHLSSITYPLLILHGKKDELANPEGSSILYDNATSDDKALRFWDGLYHEILNEPEQNEIRKYLSAWIEERI